MGPKKKEKNTKKRLKKDSDKDKSKKEEPKKPDVEKEPMLDYDWLPKKRKPKEVEVFKKPLQIDDGLWLWPGDRKTTNLRSETFWVNGKPPTSFDHPREKLLKEEDRDLVFTKESPFVKVKPPNVKLDDIPPMEIEDANKKVWCQANCALVERNTIVECPQHEHVKPAIFVETEVVEKTDKGDILKTEVQIPCGDGLQSLCWLGHVACTQLAFIKNEAFNKFLPLSIKSMDGHVLDVNTSIREVLGDGSHVTIDCSSGPRTYAQHWDGRPLSPTEKECIKSYFTSIPDVHIFVDTPPPKPSSPKKKKKRKGEMDLPRATSIDPNDPDAPPPEFPPPLFFDMEIQTSIDIVTFIDWQAFDVPKLLVEIKGDTDEEIFKVEWMIVLEMLTAYSGAIEAMLLWFGGQGVELEDKDFCLLNIVGSSFNLFGHVLDPLLDSYNPFLSMHASFEIKGYLEQFQKLFHDMKLSPKPFTENKLKEYFEKYGTVNNATGAYQLSSWGFFPILLHLFHFSGFYGKFGVYYQANPFIPLHEKIWHFLTVVLLSNFATLVKPKLEDLHLAETIESLETMKELQETTLASLMIVNPEYVEPRIEGGSTIDQNEPILGLLDLSIPEAKTAAIEAAILKQEHEEELLKTKHDHDAPIVFVNVWTQVDMEVDVQVIMPHFKKWLVFGDHWDDFLVATVTIYALQKSKNVLDFTVKQHSLRFGIEEIQRFLLAASHCLYNEQCKPLLRVSEHSFLCTYLQEIFVRAKVAKPLYTTYKEKLEYMRLQCFRHEEPLPPILEKNKGFK